MQRVQRVDSVHVSDGCRSHRYENRFSFLLFFITRGSFSDTSLLAHLEHILIISISQRKCVIAPWYFLRDVKASSWRHGVIDIRHIFVVVVWWDESCHDSSVCVFHNPWSLHRISLQGKWWWLFFFCFFLSWEEKSSYVKAQTALLKTLIRKWQLCAYAVASRSAKPWATLSHEMMQTSHRNIPDSWASGLKSSCCELTMQTEKKDYLLPI